MHSYYLDNLVTILVMYSQYQIYHNIEIINNLPINTQYILKNSCTKKYNLV